jgi:cobalamin-dependent methionine synthase I
MIIIGEKINGTIADVRNAILDRDAEYIASLVRSQDDAGADYIDVNVGTGIGDEREAMAWAIEVVRATTDLPICVDSPDPCVIEAGLALCAEQKPFINSVTGSERSMELVLPMAARYDCPLVALPMDDAGIPPSSGSRSAPGSTSRPSKKASCLRTCSSTPWCSR